jgi:hypothetical protein
MAQNPAKKEDKAPTPNGSSAVDLTPDPVVVKLQTHGGDCPDVIVISGYLGPSKKPDHVRLYIGLDLREYYEIPTNGFVYAQPMTAVNEAEPRKFLVKGTAKLEFVQCLTASFLQGPFTSSFPLGSKCPIDVKPKTCLGCPPPTSGGVSTKSD